MAQLSGTFWALLLYDVCEEIKLDVARDLLGAGPPERRPEFRGAAPEYVRFARPPIIYSAGTLTLGSGEAWSITVKLYDYGVLSVALALPFECAWGDVAHLSTRWLGSAQIEQQALEIARSQAGRIKRALVKPYSDWTVEDYYVVHLSVAHGTDGQGLSASELITDYGQKIAQMVRAESTPLSDSEVVEITREFVSYYPTDILVVTWMAALVYDTAEGAVPMIQLLEYANTQLLEFRHYDDLLTKELSNVYSSLERRPAMLRRWTMAAKAERLNRIRLEVVELTERIDNAIKFLSDMFYARAYRLAARRIGVIDYRELVDDKLKTAADLYQSMVGEFHQARAFLLEAMVVAILIIELVMLFKGGPGH